MSKRKAILFPVLLAALTSISLSSCGGDTTSNKPTSSAPTTSETSETTSETTTSETTSETTLPTTSVAPVATSITIDNKTDFTGSPITTVSANIKLSVTTDPVGCAWEASSSNEAVATIIGKYVHFVGVGEVTITVTSGTVSDNLTITVLAWNDGCNDINTYTEAKVDYKVAGKVIAIGYSTAFIQDTTGMAWVYGASGAKVGDIVVSTGVTASYAGIIELNASKGSFNVIQGATIEGLPTLNYDLLTGAQLDLNIATPVAPTTAHIKGVVAYSNGNYNYLRIEGSANFVRLNSVEYKFLSFDNDGNGLSVGKSIEFDAVIYGKANSADTGDYIYACPIDQSKGITVGSDVESYDVTIENSEHGTVTAASSKVAYGADVVLTITADDGYALTSILVDNVEKLTEVAEGKLTVKMPLFGVNVKAVFGVSLDPTKDYAITVGEHVNGNIVASAATCKKDEEVSFTLTADAGYVLKAFLFNGADKTAELKNGVYTTTLVTPGITVSATFELIADHGFTAINTIAATSTGSMFGVIRAFGYNTAFVYDGTGYAWLYSKNIHTAYQVGDVISFDFTVSEYSGTLEVVPANIIIPVMNYVGATDATPITLDQAALDGYVAAAPLPTYATYKGTFFGISGTYAYVQIVGSENVIRLNSVTYNYLDTFTAGDEITLTGIFYGSASAGSKETLITGKKYVFCCPTVTPVGDTTKYAVTVGETTNGTVVADVAEAMIGTDVTLTITPATDYILESITINDIDKTASVSDGKLVVKMVKNGLTIVAKFKVGVEKTYTKKCGFDFSTNTASGTFADVAAVKTYMDSFVQTDEGLTNLLDSVTSFANGYEGYAGYTNLGMKFGTSKLAGSLVLKLTTAIDKVVLNVAGWTVSDSIDVNGASFVPGVAYSGENSVKEHEYVLAAATDTITITLTKRAFIQSISFYTVDK